jgi:hypothetical protein
VTATWPTGSLVGSDQPLVLLPVRLETRYQTTPRGLRVRIFPDEIHADRLDDVLSFPEQAAGHAYWASIWTGTDEAAAFAQLGRQVGARRAAWVAQQTTPDNLDERPDPPGAQPPPRPPVVLVGDAQATPFARGLPERFVAAALTRSGALVSVATGERVTDPLPLDVASLARELPDDAPHEPGELRVAPDARWAVDYKKACEVGMGITLPLADAGPLFEPLRVLVLGVRAGDGASTLEQLLRAHRFTSDLEVLPPGAPTNNTESDRTAWSSAAAPRAPRTRVAPPADRETDGPRLATALGIGRDLLDDAPGATGRARQLGVDARTALWPASWGSFFDVTLDIETGGATLKDALRDSIRDHYERDVAGGGPLRVLRVGRQPYGVLPVLGPFGDGFVFPDHAQVEPIAATVERVRGLVGDVRAPQAARDFLEVLGTAPASLGLRFRIGLPNLEELLAPVIVDPFGAGPPPPAVPQEVAEREAIARMFGLGFGRLGNVVFEPSTFPLLLPLVHESDRDYAARLLTGADRRIASVLQALLELGRDRERRTAAAGTGSLEAPVDLAAQVGATVSPELAGRLAGLSQIAGDASALRDVAEALHRERGGDQAGPSMLAELQPLHMQHWFSSLLVAAELDPAPTVQAKLRSAALEAWCRGTSRALRFDTAMTRLVAADVEDRRTAVAEALDTSSHRLDAWITSFAARRLDGVRADGHAGTVLGAYGWVDELPPPDEIDGRGTPPGGFMHAPSIAQATVAGILRSANLANGEAFAVDLTSRRVRTALDLLGGVRGGQSLGALLGYRIERALHEHHAALEQFVLTLRTLAPASAGLITAASGTEAVTTVLDGIALLRLPPDAIRAALAPASSSDIDAVLAVIEEARETADAVADFLLADSVHALAGGATARAAAVLDGAAGEAPAPEPDFHRTPTQGLPLTHRDLLLIAAPAPVAPWPTGSPRAQAEPWLEAWAAGRLGPPPQAAVAAGLSALDAVYTSDAEPPPAALPAPTLALARALRRLVAGARPLQPVDLVRTGAPAVRTVDGDLELRARAALHSLTAGLGSIETLAKFGIDVSAGADAARAEGKRRADEAAALAASATPDWTAVGAALFGPAFRMLPRLAASSGDASVVPNAAVQPPRSDLRRFLRDAATVRPAVARHAATLLLADALFGPAPLLRVLQPGAPDARWVALPFEAPPERPVTSLVAEVAGTPDALHTVAGLVLDEWVEILPTRSTVTSGVAVHANAPNARPPQAMLVAVRPDTGDWTVELLAQTLSSTLDLAKLRAVTLEHSAWLGHVLPALLTPMFSLDDEPVLDFQALSLSGNAAPIPYVSER